MLAKVGDSFDLIFRLLNVKVRVLTCVIFKLDYCRLFLFFGVHMFLTMTSGARFASALMSFLV